MPNIFSVFTSKLFGGLSIALLLFSLLCWNRWGHWKDTAEELSGQIGTVVVALKQASGNDDVTWKTAAGQIVAMGESNRAMKATITANNERINDMAREAVRLRAKATELKRIADKAKAQRASALKRLSEMSLTPGTRDDCMTLLAEAEEALDLVREASEQ